MIERFSKSLILLISVFLASCASMAPDLTNFQPSLHQISVKKVLISNFIVEEKIDSTAGVWASGFIPMPNAVTKPPFHELMINTLQTGIRANGNADDGTLEIAVLRANMLMEVHIADSVAFVGILSAMAERQYMCRLDVNFRHGDKSSRKTFEALDKRSRGLGDLETNDRAKLTRDCVNKILNDVSDYSRSFVASK